MQVVKVLPPEVLGVPGAAHGGRSGRSPGSGPQSSVWRMRGEPVQSHTQRTRAGELAKAVVLRQDPIVAWGSVRGTLPFSCPFGATSSSKRQQRAEQSEGRK